MTLETLPGEGDTETTKRIRVRVKCAECKKDAHYKHTFVLPHARTNPASSGYGKDDISWCADTSVYSCEEHKDTLQRLDGYEWCSTYPASERFAHMFLKWKNI